MNQMIYLRWCICKYFFLQIVESIKSLTLEKPKMWYMYYTFYIHYFFEVDQHVYLHVHDINRWLMLIQWSRWLQFGSTISTHTHFFERPARQCDWSTQEALNKTSRRATWLHGCPHIILFILRWLKSLPNNKARRVSARPSRQFAKKPLRFHEINPQSRFKSHRTVIL